MLRIEHTLRTYFDNGSSLFGRKASHETPPPHPSEITAFELPSPSEFPVTFRGGEGGYGYFLELHNPRKRLGRHRQRQRQLEGYDKMTGAVAFPGVRREAAKDKCRQRKASAAKSPPAQGFQCPLCARVCRFRISLHSNHKACRQGHSFPMILRPREAAIKIQQAAEKPDTLNLHYFVKNKLISFKTIIMLLA